MALRTPLAIERGDPELPKLPDDDSVDELAGAGDGIGLIPWGDLSIAEIGRLVDRWFTTNVPSTNRLIKKFADNSMRVGYDNDLATEVDYSSRQIMILGLGPHEVVGFWERPPPSLSFTRALTDIRNFLRFLCLPKSLGGVIEYKGRLVWIKTHFIWQTFRYSKATYQYPFRIHRFYRNMTSLWYDEIVNRNKAIGVDWYETTSPDSAQFSRRLTDQTGCHFYSLREQHAAMLMTVLKEMGPEDGFVCREWNKRREATAAAAVNSVKPTVSSLNLTKGNSTEDSEESGSLPSWDFDPPVRIPGGRPYNLPLY